MQARRQEREPLLPFGIFRDRNFAVGAAILAALGFSMVGIFLPMTIYLQSVLGLSALDAGLTIAPQAVTMMLVSPLVAMLLPRLGAKAILAGGLTIFVAAVAAFALTVSAGADRWAYLLPLIVMGLGLGATWTPLYDLGTHDLEPRLAGAASGLMSTVQELGAVLGSASVGAVLQDQLARSLVRMDYQHAFVEAMRPSLVLPIVLIGVGIAVTLAARPPRTTPEGLAEAAS